MRSILFFITLNLFFCKCTQQHDVKIKEVYNDRKGLKLRVFIPGDWSEYEVGKNFKNEETEYSSIVGSKDTTSWMSIKINHYDGVSSDRLRIDSILKWEMSMEKSGNTTTEIINKKVYKNASGKEIGTCYYSVSGLNDKRNYFKKIVFVRGEKVGMITLTNGKGDSELLMLASDIENTLDF